VNRSPRNILIALVASGALVVSTAACGSTGGGPVSTPNNGGTHQSYSDCDLDDLMEGDSDCNDPRAYADAQRKYGASKVAKAKAKYAEKLRKKQREAVKKAERVRPRSTATTKSSSSLFGSSGSKSNRSTTKKLFGR
jgi:hypothetical protein